MVASYPAPDHPRDEAPYHAAPVEELRGRLAAIGGVPPEILRDDELFRLMLPTLRADFAVFETYRYEPEAPLDADIHAIIGADDPHVIFPRKSGHRIMRSEALPARV